MYTTRNLFTVIALLPSLHAVAQDTSSELISPVGSAPNVPLSELLPTKEEIALPDNMASETPTPAVSPSQNATINLISALVKKGVLTQAEAVALIQQAEEEAMVARSEAEADAAPSMDPAGQRVTYIPEVVKNEMRDRIQQELIGAEIKPKTGLLVSFPLVTSAYARKTSFLRTATTIPEPSQILRPSTAAHPSTPPAPSSPHNITSIKIAIALAYVLAPVLKFFSERDSTQAYASQPVIQILQPHPTKLSVVAKAISRNTICGWIAPSSPTTPAPAMVKSCYSWQAVLIILSSTQKSFLMMIWASMDSQSVPM
jgi:polyhydroxyalkanoate synthesis regulator phasin